MIWHHTKRVLFGLSFLLIVGMAAAFIGVQSRGGKLLSVQTGSMVPTLQRGDLVAITGVPKGQYAVGDVITYTNPKNNKQTITHRIVELPSAKNYQKFIVKGDANAAPDNPVDPTAVLGKVEFSAPFAGFAVDFVRKPIGLAMLIYIPAALIVIDEIKRLSRYYQKKKAYKSAQISGRDKENGKTTKQKFATAGNITGALILITVIVALPVHALLMSQAVLQTNTISATRPQPPPTGPHVMFRKVTFRCSSDNTVSSNKRPVILIQNWTTTNFVATGWTIQDNTGPIINIPDGFVFKKLRQYSFTPLLANGLQYSGDHLSLVNNLGQTVDALSWGTDTTAFNPSIASPAAGTRLERRPFNKDTNTTADWRAFNHVCNCPVQPDVEAGDDSGGLGDRAEANRVMTVGAFNLEEI